MAATFAFSPSSDKSPVIVGHRRHASGTITFDSSYPTNGYPITAALFGLTQLHSLRGSGTTLAGRPAAWDSANAKIKVFKAVATEADNATDLSADSLKVEVWGI